MRGAPSDLEIETKNPRRMLPARANQTRLDDVILPVFCPTCQTNELIDDAKVVRAAC